MFERDWPAGGGNRRHGIGRSLGAALHDHSFGLRFQPRLDIATNGVQGIEARTTWEHPAFGTVGFDEMCGAASSTRLLLDLVGWIIHHAGGQFAKWHRLRYPIGRLLLPLPFGVLLHPDAVGWLARRIRSVELAAAAVQFEVFDAPGVGANPRFDLIVERLHDRGFGVVIEGFGNPPVADAKVSARSMISGESAVPVELRNRRLLVDGIETYEQFARVTDLGCDGIQGDFICPPLSPAQFTDWIVSRSAAAAAAGVSLVSS